MVLYCKMRMFAYFYETSRRQPLGWNLNSTTVSILNLAGVSSFIISEISSWLLPLDSMSQLSLRSRSYYFFLIFLGDLSYCFSKVATILLPSFDKVIATLHHLT